MPPNHNRRPRLREALRDGSVAASDVFAGVQFTRAGRTGLDLLYCRRRDLTAVPLVQRRRRLTELVADLAHPHVLAPLYIVGPGKKLFYEIAKRDLEGVMAKRLDSPYLPGKRSAHWLKIKVRPAGWRIYEVRDEEDDDLWKRDDEDEAGDALLAELLS